jgi:hypothetical protein
MRALEHLERARLLGRTTEPEQDLARAEAPEEAEPEPAPHLQRRRLAGHDGPLVEEVGAPWSGRDASTAAPSIRAGSTPRGASVLRAQTSIRNRTSFPLHVPLIRPFFACGCSGASARDAASRTPQRSQK